MRFRNELLIEMRRGKGYSREELARLSGVSENAIWKIESGRSQSPRLPIVEKLAMAFDVDPQVFFEVNAHVSEQLA